MALKTVPELGNVKCANCVGLMAQADLHLSPSEYGETQVSARRTGVTSLNIEGTGANLRPRAGSGNNFRIADHTIQLSFLCLG
jgi:hypothetical protein